MYQFNVEDMTCGHCVSRVTKAVKAVGRRLHADGRVGMAMSESDSACPPSRANELA